MSDIRSKNKIIYMLVLFSLLLSSCSSDDKEETDPYKSLNLKSGYINIYYDGIKTELKEIVANYYLNSDRDTLGIVYTGFVDKWHLISKNSVSLYISKNSTLDRIDFVYSAPGTNYGTVFTNSSEQYYNEKTYLNHNLSCSSLILEGQFDGKLFNPVETIHIDSCKFYIKR